MFSDNKKERHMADTSSSQNIIAKGTKLVGDINSEGDFRIDGTIEGNVNTKGKIVLGKTGVITGTLNGTDAYFEGDFSGKLTLSGTLTLKASANVEGEVVAGKLAVEPGATFNVSCSMQGGAKPVGKSDRKTAKAV